MTAFLPFARKPQKTIASMICKYSHFVAKPTTQSEWMFQGPVKRGRGPIRVHIVDFRDFLTRDYRDWADEVGWDSPWALAISISHKRRTDEEYIFWHAMTIALKNAYEQAGLVGDEIWLSSEEDGFPTTPFTILELLPDVISADAEDVNSADEEEEEVSQPEPEPLPPPPRMRAKPSRPESRIPRPPKREPEPEPDARTRTRARARTRTTVSLCGKRRLGR